MIRDEHPAMIMGEVASSGVARGSAVVCACAEHTAGPRRAISETEAQKEMEKFDAAISEAQEDLLELQKDVHQRVGKKEAEILEMQILLLHDSSLREEVNTRCLTEKVNVEAAVDEAVKKLTSLFVRLKDPYFRERAADLRDVGKRLLDILTKGQSPGMPTLSDGSVIVTSELLEIKNAIRETSLQRAEGLASRILQLGTIQEIKDCLRQETLPKQ